MTESTYTELIRFLAVVSAGFNLCLIIYIRLLKEELKYSKSLNKECIAKVAKAEEYLQAIRTYSGELLNKFTD